MIILIKERRVEKVPYIPYQNSPHRMLFDIVFWPNCRESKKEVNKKGTRFRNKVVKKLKPGDNRVRNFMPMSEDIGDTYAFFVIICSLGSRTGIETIIRKSIEDGDLVFFEQKDI